MTNHERARHAFDAADACHELERCLRSVAESLRRDEEPDPFCVAGISSIRMRLDVLIGHGLDDATLVREATRKMFAPKSA